MEKISIQISIHSNVKTVWNAWTNPEAITQWNFASDEWHCPAATNDLQVGSTFSYRMEAKDGSMGFDFEGTYDAISEFESIEYHLEDGRKVWVEFSEKEGQTTIKETFEAEDIHSAEQQRLGWLAILQNFKAYVEQG